MHKRLKSLLLRWRLIKFTEMIFLDLMIYSILHYFESSELLSSYIILTISILYLIKTRVFKRSMNDVLEHLNHEEKDLEYSSKLLLKKETDLNFLETFQIEKISSILKKTKHFSIKTNLYFIAICAAVSILFFQMPRFAHEVITLDSKKIQDTESAVKNTLSIKSTKVTIRPHSYLKKRASQIQSTSFTVHKYSTLNWEIEISDEIKSAKILLSRDKTISFKKSKEKHYQSQNFFIIQSDYYRFQIIGLNNDTLISEYGKITITDDQRPKIAVSLKEQYINLNLAESQSISFNTTISDDIALRDARLIATVSRGKGESIKFREEQLSFDIRSQNMKRQRHDVELIFSKFNMLPGDELYFYILVTDNNPFEPGVQKSETYYIALEDTAEDINIDAAAIGVNQMPAYFRSQRQIIIDTEKLIANRPKIPQQSFLEDGNEIGHDQKILRLKYGQFLGEEFESDDVDPRAKSEELEDHSADDGHDHDDIAKANLKQNIDEILEPYVHAHDLTAQNNFFDPRLKAKMRKVLREMWGSELYLRIGEPKKALPYQYRALKLLKEIKYESRIYVQRIGFEAPALNVDEYRLSKVDAAPESKRRAKQSESKKYEAFSDLMLWLESAKSSTYNRIDFLDEILTTFSDDFLESRVNRLSDLNSISLIRNNKTLSNEARLALRNSIYRFLEKNSKSLINPKESKSKLDDLYKKSLGRLLNE